MQAGFVLSVRSKHQRTPCIRKARRNTIESIIQGTLIPAGSSISPSAATNQGATIRKPYARTVAVYYNVASIASGQSVDLSFFVVGPDGVAYEIYLSSLSISAPGSYVFYFGLAAEASGTAGSTTVTSLALPLGTSFYVVENFTNTGGDHPIVRSLAYELI